MNCAERKNLLLEYAAGALEPTEREEIRTHMEGGCIQCTANLAEAHELLSQLQLSLAPIDPSQSAKRRLMERVQRMGNSTHRAWIRPALFGAIAAGIVIGLISCKFLLDAHVRLLQLSSAISNRDQQIHVLEGQVSKQQNTIRMIDSPSTQLVTLQGTQTQVAATGKLLWDPNTQTARFVAIGLKPLPADKTYELWLVNDRQQRIPAGTFRVNTGGEASITSSAVGMQGALALVAVTDEPAGGLPQPSGTFQLLGQVK